MNQDALKESLDGLERKVLLLLKERRALQQALESARAERRTLEQEVARKDNTISELSNAVKVEKIASHAGTLDGMKDAHELKKTIDEYILEIDRCIARLNA